MWDDPKNAQRVLRAADGLRDELALWGALLQRADDLDEIAELAQTDAALASEVDAEADALRIDYERERTALLFSGPYDDRNALLTVS
ncbi:MAG TPA: PCRF domain-containing protein, partial [Candidatus Saccharimonadia bacterium]|nr:PCRF domain-containing protein [Candidatus Saccharimonadia bacterium]